MSRKGTKERNFLTQSVTFSCFFAGNSPIVTKQHMYSLVFDRLGYEVCVLSIEWRLVASVNERT